MRDALLGDEPKDLAHQARTRPFDPCRAPRLAEVLTREPRHQEIGPGWERIEETNVFGEGDVREACLKDGTRRAIDLAEKGGLVARPGPARAQDPRSRRRGRPNEASALARKRRAGSWTSFERDRSGFSRAVFGSGLGSSSRSRRSWLEHILESSGRASDGGFDAAPCDDRTIRSRIISWSLRPSFSTSRSLIEKQDIRWAARRSCDRPYRGAACPGDPEHLSDSSKAIGRRQPEPRHSEKLKRIDAGVYRQLTLGETTILPVPVEPLAESPCQHRVKPLFPGPLHSPSFGPVFGGLAFSRAA